MKTTHGDLITMGLAAEFDVIVHGCNCCNVMGSGIAADMRKEFPEAWAADLGTKDIPKEEKLGTISVAEVRFVKDTRPLYVVNAYTQLNPGAGSLSYDALRNCFKLIKNRFSGNRIGYPMIGAGIAKGDWTIISKIIDEELEGEDHTFVVYKPNLWEDHDSTPQT